MIEKTIADWHAHLRGKLPGGLDALLHDDCVFYSPVVFTPQRGKEITKLYLNAAGATLGDDDGPAGSTPAETRGDSAKKGFRYTKEILCGHHAVLEFETELEGKYVNGIDMITCDDRGRIIEFKVLVRPLQAINLLHQQMARMLESMKG